MSSSQRRSHSYRARAGDMTDPDSIAEVVDITERIRDHCQKSKNSYKLEAGMLFLSTRFKLISFAALLRVRLEERDKIIKNQKELIAHLTALLGNIWNVVQTF